jgi:magnesium-transporting ATPase (P-type)
MMSGSAYARSQSDMVLTTNDFESCLRAVMWGRNIYSNIKRFL